MDGGESFRSCRLTAAHEILQVHDILADPNASSSNFLVLGTDGDSSDAQVYISHESLVKDTRQ